MQTETRYGGPVRLDCHLKSENSQSSPNAPLYKPESGSAHHSASPLAKSPFVDEYAFLQSLQGKGNLDTNLAYPRFFRTKSVHRTPPSVNEFGFHAASLHGDNDVSPTSPQIRSGTDGGASDAACAFETGNSPESQRISKTGLPNHVPDHLGTQSSASTQLEGSLYPELVLTTSSESIHKPSPKELGPDPSRLYKVPIPKERLSVYNAYPIHAHYRIEERVGRGTWGHVCVAVERYTGLRRALKTFPKRLTKDLPRFRAELTYMKELDHPNIIKAYETFEDTHNLYLIMELCTGGELYDHIVLYKSFSELEVAVISHQILSAVLYLHNKKVAHRDLKPENFLFLSDKPKATLKLIDFGLSKRFSYRQKLVSRVGSMYYMAPEVLKGAYDEKVDMWSIGVIVYILLYGYPPFKGTTDVETYDKICSQELSFISTTSKKVSQYARNFVSSLLEKVPEKRLSAHQAFQHEWFQTVSPVVIRELSLPLESRLRNQRDPPFSPKRRPPRSPGDENSVACSQSDFDKALDAYTSPLNGQKPLDSEDQCPWQPSKIWKSASPQDQEEQNRHDHGSPGSHHDKHEEDSFKSNRYILEADQLDSRSKSRCFDLAKTLHRHHQSSPALWPIASCCNKREVDCRVFYYYSRLPESLVLKHRHLISRLLPRWKWFVRQDHMFRTVMRVIARLMDDEDPGLHDLRCLFLALDWECDGVLTPDEMKTGIGALQALPVKPASSNDQGTMHKSVSYSLPCRCFCCTLQCRVGHEETDLDGNLLVCASSLKPAQPVLSGTSVNVSSVDLGPPPEDDQAKKGDPVLSSRASDASLSTIRKIRECYVYDVDQIESRKDLHELIPMVSLDGRGILDYYDFMAASMDTPCVANDDILKAAFRVFDRNADEKLCRSELIARFAWFDGHDSASESLLPQSPALERQHIIEEELRIIFSRWDHDRDGCISYQEFHDTLRDVMGSFRVESGMSSASSN